MERRASGTTTIGLIAVAVVFAACEPTMEFAVTGMREGAMLESAPAWTAPQSAFHTQVAWGDINADGGLDLASADFADPVQTFLNTGGGLAQGWSSTLSEQTNALAFGDMDGDGDLDLAISNYGSSTGNSDPIRVYENDGLGGFTSAWDSPEIEQNAGVAWADWDGDGDLDLAVATSDFTQPSRVYENEGGNSFSLAWSSTIIGKMAGVAWADWDNDGDADLAICASNFTPDRIYANNGNCATAPATCLTEVWTEPTVLNGGSDCAWGDLDGDGDLEFGETNTQAINTIYRNLGTCGTNPGACLNVLWTSPESDYNTGQAWADFDLDGDLDLGVSNQTEVNRVYENTSTGFVVSGWVPSSNATGRRPAWGDWDNDGDFDFAVPNGTGQSNQATWVYENTGGALALGWTASSGANTTDVEWGDWDGDGDLDLALADGGGSAGPNTVLRNDGGSLALAWSSAESDSTSGLAWGDWNDDGDLDLAVANYQGPVRVYDNTGGSLALAWSSDDSGVSQEVAWGDVDGDGDLDLAVARKNGQANVLYENSGGALSLLPVWTSTETDDSRDLAWGDWDDDGDLDLAVANGTGSPGQVNRVYINDGSEVAASALSQVWTSTEDDYSEALDWGDWDGDGDLDLAVANSNGQVNRLYENQGGVLVLGPAMTETETSRDVAWGDWDGDGDLDLAVGDALSAGNRIYENTGAALVPAWVSDEAETTHRLAWSDWDNDGDLDLAVANYSGELSRVYENHRITDPLLPNNPTYAVVDALGTTDPAASGISSAEVLTGPIVVVPFALYDAESDEAPSVRLEYSPHGGGQWLPATLAGTSGPTTFLAASPTGVPHTLDWDMSADVIGVIRYAARVRVIVEWQNPTFIAYPIQHGELAAVSPSFRLDPCTGDADGDGTPCGADCDDTDATLNDLDVDSDGVTTCDAVPDCDDADATNYPGNAELCDGQDNDCVGGADADAAGEVDADTDTSLSCADCDDADAANLPGGTEVCDGQDNDCTGGADFDLTGEVDVDSDGELSCVDCDDGDTANFFANTELCDGQDNDCDGSTWAALGEGDGDGDTSLSCADCDDADAANLPGLRRSGQRLHRGRRLRPGWGGRRRC